MTQTEPRLVFKHPPRLGLELRQPHTQPDQLVIRLDTSTGTQIQLQARRADAHKPEPITLDMLFAESGGEGHTAYGVLLQAAIEGQQARFTRQDTVEEQWRIMQPLLDAPPPVVSYPPGSWGPPSAGDLVAPFGGWRAPWT